MIHFKPVIRKNQKNNQGLVNIKIRITKNRKSTYLSTDFWVMPEQFDSKKGKVNGKHQSYKKINLKLRKLVLDFEERLLDSTESGYNLTIQSIKDELTGKNFKEQDFFTLSNEIINENIRKGKKGNAETYKTAKNTVKDFLNKSHLSFKEINYNFLNKYENWLLENGKSVNGASVYLRNIRAVYNRAIDLEIIGFDHYPFRRFKIKNEESLQRYLDLDEIKKINNATLKGKLEFARDVFMLSFFLIGINMKDLYELASIKKGNIEYRRSKTGKLFSIAVPQEAEGLINKYRGENDFLLFSEHYSDHKNFTKTVNKYLKKVAAKCEIDKPLSTYYARHTWATLAAVLDIPKETISRALGHSRNSITDIYINFDRGKIDEANKRVIQLLCEKAANSSAAS